MYSTYLPVVANNWYQIGVSWDLTAKQFKYYLNGSLINSWTWTTFAPNNSNFQVGYDTLSAGISIDKIRIYEGQVLSDTEFTNIYNYELPSFS